MNPIKVGKDTLKRDISKCIICKRDQAKVKLSTSEDGRAKIQICIEKLGDPLKDTKAVYKATCPRGYSLISGTLLNQSFPSLNEKPCVVCVQWKHKSYTKRHCLCEMNRAKNFIKAPNFHKE